MLFNVFNFNRVYRTKYITCILPIIFVVISLPLDTFFFVYFPFYVHLMNTPILLSGSTPRPVFKLTRPLFVRRRNHTDSTQSFRPFHPPNHSSFPFGSPVHSPPTPPDRVALVDSTFVRLCLKFGPESFYRTSGLFPSIFYPTLNILIEFSQ